MSLRVRLLFNFPTYKVLAISIVSIIVGAASIALSVIGLVNQIWGHYVATGIWSGSVMAITGFFGIASAQTRGVCVVKTFMMFSIFSSLVSLGVIALSIGGLIYNSRFYSDGFYGHPNTKLIHGLLLGTGVLQSILSVICAAISVKHICCHTKQKPGQAVSNIREQNEFRRGDTRSSHSSSAPLISRHKRKSGSDAERPRSSECHTSDAHANGAQPSTSQLSENSKSLKHTHRERKSKDKKHHRSRSFDNDHGQRRSREADRNQHTTQRKRSPDRYANKPEAASATKTFVHTRENHTAIDESDVAINIEFQTHTHLLDDMDGLPPYEEVIRDGNEDSFASLPIVQNDIMTAESISLSSYNDVAVRSSFDQNGDEFTPSKEIAAEQEALLCLSAALETPGMSSDLESTDLISNNVVFRSNLNGNRLSAGNDSDSEGLDQLTMDRDICNNSNDEHETPHLPLSARRALQEKYTNVDPDPQGVIYKQFSRHSDVIRESIKDNSKPKRSKSFQQTRERDFARGKSSSSRHLSFDTNETGLERLDKTKTSVSENNFRPISKSFSRASGTHGKPPPKPPRTSSLKQANGYKKERPKSATLPHSQFAVIDIQGDRENNITANDRLNRTNETKETREENTEKSNVIKIQPPRFRYPRPKLTDTTFQEYRKHPVNSQELEIPKFCDETTSSPRVLSHSINDSGIGMGDILCMPENNQDRNLTLPLVTAHSSSENNQDRKLTLPLVAQSVQSPLKSPTDLKEILLKGQHSTKPVTRRVSTNSISSSSDELSIDESIVDRSEASANVDVALQETDDEIPTDSDGKPMYSFLL